ncbi:hypothetical protein NL676_025358 [Syzygium grande]|nr:hypothetical protein NL676_025358 [Syzygium grande]
MPGKFNGSRRSQKSKRREGKRRSRSHWFRLETKFRVVPGRVVEEPGGPVGPGADPPVGAAATTALESATRLRKLCVGDPVT